LVNKFLATAKFHQLLLQLLNLQLEIGEFHQF
jgi:hypothetical protein